MKQIYTVLFIICALTTYAQTTVNYPQREANYNATFGDGGGRFDSNTNDHPVEGLGMWANGGNTKSVAWRNFTQDGSTSGTATTMAVGDSFTITVHATQASYGVIGLALLSSPSATATWDDRINNYALQVNLNGNDDANDPWEVVSNAGTIDASNIGGSQTYADFKFKFTLNTATNMTVSINDGAASFNVTLNNENITGYSVYFDNDWNGAANSNIYWIPTTEYIYATTLSNNEDNIISNLELHPNPTKNSFSINKDIKDIAVYNITGKLIKSIKGTFSKNKSFDISDLSKGIYLIKATDNSGALLNAKLIKE